MIYRRRASVGMALYALLTDQIQQVAIGLLYAGSGIFRMTDFFKNGLQQHAILILLFSKQRQKTQGWFIALRLRLFRQAGKYRAALLIIFDGFAKEILQGRTFSAVGSFRFHNGPGAWFFHKIKDPHHLRDTGLRSVTEKSGGTVQPLLSTPFAQMQIQIWGIELKIHLVIQLLNHSWYDHTNILIHFGGGGRHILTHLHQGRLRNYDAQRKSWLIVFRISVQPFPLNFLSQQI